MGVFVNHLLVFITYHLEVPELLVVFHAQVTKHRLSFAMYTSSNKRSGMSSCPQRGRRVEGYAVALELLNLYIGYELMWV
jgi:hypothetical protein